MITLEDPTLPHQIRFRLMPNGHLMLTCNCGEKIGARAIWPTPEAMREWRKHVPEAVSTSKDVAKPGR